MKDGIGVGAITDIFSLKFERVLFNFYVTHRITMYPFNAEVLMQLGDWFQRARFNPGRDDSSGIVTSQ